MLCHWVHTDVVGVCSGDRLSVSEGYGRLHVVVVVGVHSETLGPVCPTLMREDGLCVLR